MTQTMTTQENYSLRWNNHQSHILQSFDALLQQKSLVDVTLVCSDRSIRAHKVVLSACSPFFERVFNDTPCKHPVIVLKDFKGWLVQAIVDFMYRGEISVPQKKLNLLIQAGESLQIRGLTIPTESVDDSARESCASPMPRRKQARPRRRSGDLTDSPQDLSNGTIITKCERDDSLADDFDDDDLELNDVSKRMKLNGTSNELKASNDDNNNGMGHDDNDLPESEEKENQPTERLMEGPENLCMKKSVDESHSSENLTSGDKNNNNDENREKRKQAAPNNDFHERFILSLKDLRHLRHRQVPPGHPFSDILSHLPISPPPSFHLNHADIKDGQNLKHDSDHSDDETPSFADQMDLVQHRNQLNANLEKISREHHKHQQQMMQNHQNSSIGFPPPFHQGNDGQMRVPGHHGHSSSPLSFPSMSSVSALTLTPPHMFGLDSPLGMFPPGMDPSKMYNPLMDLPEHHPGHQHHRSLHPDHQPYLKKKLSRPKGQHSAPRGGPPRSWTNAELTEALQHVWNKKMTTSQASRIFGIPYNSLLMYVRGKYGKSLKLEQLRKDCISGPPIELLQMGPTAQANENKKKEKSGPDGDEAQVNRENSHGQQSGSRRSASSESDAMMNQNPLFNPFQGGFYPEFPGAGSGFPGLQLSMLNLLPPDSRMHHQSMLPMVIDDDCKSDTGSVQSMDDSLPSTPLNLNREKSVGSSSQGPNRHSYPN